MLPAILLSVNRPGEGNREKSLRIWAPFFTGETPVKKPGYTLQFLDPPQAAGLRDFRSYPWRGPWANILPSGLISGERRRLYHNGFAYPRHNNSKSPVYPPHICLPRSSLFPPRLFGNELPLQHKAVAYPPRFGARPLPGGLAAHPPAVPVIALVMNYPRASSWVSDFSYEKSVVHKLAFWRILWYIISLMI
jgi:hypothetical protein